MLKLGFIGGDAWDAGDAPEALPLDSAKGTFEKVPLDPPKLLGQGIMKQNGGARRQRGWKVTPTFVRVRDRG